MYHANNENWQKRNNGRNKTTKSRKNQNSWREEKLFILEAETSNQKETK